METKAGQPARCRNCRGPLAHPDSIQKGLDGACEDKLRKSALSLADSLELLRSWVMQHPRASLWNERERDMLTDATNALEKAGRLL